MRIDELLHLIANNGGDGDGFYVEIHPLKSQDGLGICVFKNGDSDVMCFDLFADTLQDGLESVWQYVKR
jgi:hypothetical protein